MPRKLKRRQAIKPSPAAKDLQQFLDENEIPVSRAARELGVTHPAVFNWLRGVEPDDRNKRKIRIWTRGEISEDKWWSKREVEAIERVKPFDKGAA